MNVFEFGDAKLRLGDIDPLYIAIERAQLPKWKRQRITLAEVAFDLAGIAADIADAGNVSECNAYWGAMRQAAMQPKRGAPRRYFVKRLALKSIDWMQATYGTPERVVESLQGPYAAIRERVHREWPGWGPTAAFKIADMAERVCGNKITFSREDFGALFENSQVSKGFDNAARSIGVIVGPYPHDKVIDKLLVHDWATKASPRYDRPIGLQELETILCYYSHDEAHSKHLPGMDSLGIEAELQGHGKLAQRLIKHLPHRRPL